MTQGLSMPRTVLSVLSAAALAISFTAQAGGSGATPANRSTDANAATTRIVTIEDNSYSRSSLKLRKNDTIVFKWGRPRNRHNVTSDSGPATFHSKTTSRDGYRYTHKFTRTGTYALLCTQHPSEMQLTVKVKRRR
jgi:plastocyanin